MTKRIIISLALSILILQSCLFPLQAKTEVNVSASAVLALDYDSGRVLYAKNQDAILPPASLTKLMTALLVVEKGTLTDTVRLGNEIVGIEGIPLGIKPGDSISVEELLYALLVASSNESANALAVYAKGSITKFATAMNARGKELGLVSSNFVNPSGLPDASHVSSARDLAIVAKKALENSVISKIVNTRTKEIHWQSESGVIKRTTLQSTNKFLGVYPGVVGVKTGTTTEAGQCLIILTKWDAGKAIVVLLNSSNRYVDAGTLLDQIYSDSQLGRAGNVLVKEGLFNY